MKKYIHPDVFQHTELSLEVPFPTKASFISDPTHYELNSLGYRSPEFGEVELLTIGCSQTVGLGVDEEDIWPNLVADLTNMRHANLGIVGNSAQGMLESALAYIKDYGKPKVICALYPGMYRFKTLINKDINTALYSDFSKNLEAKNINLAFASEGVESKKDAPQISKRPHNLNDVLAYEVAVYQSVMAVNTLIEYCKVAEIKLVLSSWEPDAIEILSKKAEFAVLDDAEVFLHDSKSLNCHRNKLGDAKNRGRDSSGHMGSHQHLHFAELFTERIAR
jgi:hypothetical protein